MDAYYARNDPVHNLFVAVMRNPHATAREKKVAQDSVKDLSGVQWSMHIHNIIKKESQCPNACRYCYMIGIRRRFWGAPAPSTSDMEDIEIDDARVAKKWSTRSARKLIMMPSSHDIFPSFLAQFIAQARTILTAGHSLLIVTKPRMDCIPAIDDALAEFRDRIIYRLTITAMTPSYLEFWEPRAPSFDERFNVLPTLHERGCLTSVSIEPMLEDPRRLIAILRPFITETIWVGTMSGKQDCSDDERKRLAALATPQALRALVFDLIGPDPAIDTRIRFKTHIMEKCLA
jgi:hypothetical protein